MWRKTCITMVVKHVMFPFLFLFQMYRRDVRHEFGLKKKITSYGITISAHFFCRNIWSVACERHFARFSVWWNMIMLGHEQDLSWEATFSGSIITHLVIMQLLLLQNIIHGKRFSRSVRFWVHKKILWAYHHLWWRFSKYGNLISNCLLHLRWSLQVSVNQLSLGWLYLSGYMIACWSLHWNWITNPPDYSSIDSLAYLYYRFLAQMPISWLPFELHIGTWKMMKKLVCLEGCNKMRILSRRIPRAQRRKIYPTFTSFFISFQHFLHDFQHSHLHPVRHWRKPGSCWETLGIQLPQHPPASSTRHGTGFYPARCGGDGKGKHER